MTEKKDVSFSTAGSRLLVGFALRSFHLVNICTLAFIGKLAFRMHILHFIEQLYIIMINCNLQNQPLQIKFSKILQTK